MKDRTIKIPIYLSYDQFSSLMRICETEGRLVNDVIQELLTSKMTIKQLESEVNFWHNEFK